MNVILTQEANVLNTLKAGRTITPIEALNQFGCFRLAAIIHTLRKDGWNIYTDMVGDGKKSWAQYSLDQNRELWPE